MTNGKGFVSPTDPWVLVFTLANSSSCDTASKARYALDWSTTGSPPSKEGLLRFAHALDDLAAATRRRPSPGECQYPVLPLGDDGLAQNNFDPLRADCGALDRVSYVLLGRRVPSQTASLFVLRDRLVGAENAVVLSGRFVRI